MWNPFSLEKIEKKVETEAYRHLVEDKGFTFTDAERLCEKMAKEGHFRESAQKILDKMNGRRMN